MNKKSIRIISTLLTIAIVLMVLTSSAFAINSPSELDKVQANSVNTGAIDKAGKQIVDVIRSVGIIVSIVILMVIGIKYMMGSSEEKASYKKTMMPYIIGAVLLFGASAFAGMVFDFAGDLGK